MTCNLLITNTSNAQVVLADLGMLALPANSVTDVSNLLTKDALANSASLAAQLGVSVALSYNGKAINSLSDLCQPSKLSHIITAYRQGTVPTSASLIGPSSIYTNISPIPLPFSASIAYLISQHTSSVDDWLCLIEYSINSGTTWQTLANLTILQADTYKIHTSPTNILPANTLLRLTASLANTSTGSVTNPVITMVVQSVN